MVKWSAAAHFFFGDAPLPVGFAALIRSLAEKLPP